MPHFIVDCSEDLLETIDKRELMQLIHATAESSKLFNVKDIKVRLRPYSDYMAGVDGASSFLHVFAYIMQGRTTEQKSALSKAVVSALKERLPETPILSMNVMDFEKATYNNKQTV